MEPQFAGAANVVVALMRQVISASEISLIDLAINNNPAFIRFKILWLKAGKGCSRSAASMEDLFAGFYSQLAATVTNESLLQQKLLLKSLEAYRSFLAVQQKDQEMNYFVQWQIGLVEDMLGIEWPQVEETLLKASHYATGRAEAMKVIVQHYRGTKEYGIAYIYSSIAKNQFAGSVPEELEWFGDADLYRWKLLNYHISICKNLGNLGEMEKTSAELFSIADNHPDYFSKDQLQTIFENRQALQV